jgi:hypothetical protein
MEIKEKFIGTDFTAQSNICDQCGKEMGNITGMCLYVHESAPEYAEWMQTFGKQELKSCFCCLAKNMGFKPVRDVAFNGDKSKCDTPDKCRISPNGPSNITTAYYNPVYNGHGVNLNPDRNTVIMPVRCATCGKEWGAGKKARNC